mmetsp:Transcript_15528/g.25579  ORF Transcript_15528/g.25579 Transcript_15528/m.25579 type:complete len:1046 (-) Transcript_15528:613-3750(-)|eukprot:CAMPEP_0184342632 /NCGR_PEP_ID=MMETSP1089-20130417/11226_1 /TAXON_ID=38269 ORGANISM="Gloeochaete wittrockiana, Strain SAG46.84" /NCGR_SAMPLE_ID=MMETSP1089 /ASSEMBLY_ACC=CAM_ASM_000445 /LENGTH=1045 /DNA_ID=CAMNT_0026671587 /DNA_START=39 /DNA_END=3176 /DNA_ORIENTATION=-
MEAPGTAVAHTFGLTVDQLRVLSESRDIKDLVNLGGLEAVAASLKTDLKNGLSESEVEQNFSARREVYGTNTYPEPPAKSFFKLLWDALQDTTLRILQVASIVSIILGIFFHDEGNETVCKTSSTSHEEDIPHSGVPGWVDGAAILVAVLISALVSAVNDYTKERQFRSLNSVKNNRRVNVVRAGQKLQISIYDLVVGDVVLLLTGDQVPSDGLFIEGYNLETDESVMTGETDSIKKSKDRPFMLSGCQVVSGVGSMLVTGVGINSEWGQTMLRLSDHEEAETPLQTKLNWTVKIIGNFGVGVALLTFGALVIKWGVEIAHCPGGFKAEYLLFIVQYFIMGVTIIVVAVPEGLPLAVTISLAYSMRRMLKDMNLVRHLAACETMGGATNICSDKTGTLTENRMTVVQCNFGLQQYSSIPPPEELAPATLKLLFEGISNNSKAYISILPNGQPEYIGNKTECALLGFIQKYGADYEKIRKETVVRALYAFSSEKKRMSTMINRADAPGQFRLHVKGASETVMKMCTSFVDIGGKVSPLSPEKLAELMTRIEEMASQGLRTLCLAYKDFAQDGGAAWEHEAPEDNLTCLGLVGIKDPVRSAVPGAVETCRRAGIFVRMVTGDNILTAKHIAKECGILTEKEKGIDGIALEGPVFRTMPDDKLDELLPRLQVLARSSPQDKFKLVHRLRMLGEVVAVTGDGTNDAPALKEADVGLAMGISGTEVAKEASDVILMDDNFTSIVKAVMWGRCVYDNIRKFVQFQLTVNVVALCVAFIGAVGKGARPLKPVQLLWVNLIMDTMGALALGTESPTEELLNRKPYGRHERLISTFMLRNILGQAAYQLSILLTFFFAGKDILAPFISSYLSDESMRNKYGSKTAEKVVYTTIFNAFVLCQVFNEINSRKITEFNVFKGLFTNWLFVFIIGITLAFQILIIEFGGAWFEVVPLTWQLWLICLVIGAVSLPLGFLIKLIPVKEWPTSKTKVGQMNEQLLLEKHDSAAYDVRSEHGQYAPVHTDSIQVEVSPPEGSVSSRRKEKGAPEEDTPLTQR